MEEQYRMSRYYALKLIGISFTEKRKKKLKKKILWQLTLQNVNEKIQDINLIEYRFNYLK